MENKRPVGRPFTIDREALKQKALEYIESDGYKTITDFCCKNRLSRVWFYKICEDDKELLYISEQIKLERERHLEIGGLSGDLNAGMAKFALAQLGWSEKQEVKNTNIEVPNVSLEIEPDREVEGN